MTEIWQNGDQSWSPKMVTFPSFYALFSGDRTIDATVNTNGGAGFAPDLCQICAGFVPDLRRICAGFAPDLRRICVFELFLRPAFNFSDWLEFLSCSRVVGLPLKSFTLFTLFFLGNGNRKYYEMKRVARINFQVIHFFFYKCTLMC